MSEEELKDLDPDEMDAEDWERVEGEVLAFLRGAFPEGAWFYPDDAWTAIQRGGLTRRLPFLAQTRVTKILLSAAGQRGSRPPALWRGEDVPGRGAPSVFKDASWCLENWEPQDATLWNLRRLAIRGLDRPEAVTAEPPEDRGWASAPSAASLRADIAAEREALAERAKHALRSQDPDRQGVYGNGQEVPGMAAQNAGRGGRNLSSPIPPADAEEARRRLEVEDEEQDGGPLRGGDGGRGEGGDVEGDNVLPGGPGTGDGADGASGALREVPGEAASDLTREELRLLLDNAEKRVLELEEQWEKLRVKVEDTTESVRGRARRAREDLLTVVSGMGEIEDIDSRKQQEASTEALLKTDDARRAYAIYDALRSVSVWMRGFC